MPDVLHRTTLEYRRSVSLAYHPIDQWIQVPDLLAVATGTSGNWVFVVPKKHWDVTGDVVSKMARPERDAVDAAIVAVDLAALTSKVVKKTESDPVEGLAIVKGISGLTVSWTISNLVFDVTTVVADPSDTKFLRILYVENTDTKALAVRAHEKTTGRYASLAVNEKVVARIGEWSVPANGTVLTEV